MLSKAGCRKWTLGGVASTTLRAMAAITDPELIVGLVAPVGTNTTDLANAVQGALSGCTYKAVIIKLSDLLPTAGPAPGGEAEDLRIRRLIAAGNRFCEDNEDSAAIARLAINKILENRIGLLRQDGDSRDVDEQIVGGRPRTAYILQSLKRLDEVQLLREVYGGQFILIGSQGSVAQRTRAWCGATYPRRMMLRDGRSSRI